MSGKCQGIYFSIVEIVIFIAKPREDVYCQWVIWVQYVLPSLHLFLIGVIWFVVRPPNATKLATNVPEWGGGGGELYTSNHSIRPSVCPSIFPSLQ